MHQKRNTRQQSAFWKVFANRLFCRFQRSPKLHIFLARDIGNEAAAHFVANLATTELTLEAPLQEDYLRSAEILRQYADANLDFVDALIAAIAERLNIARLLTLDRRDFQLIPPKHCRSFELLP
jgi:predicted nucleic acid-binding protein